MRNSKKWDKISRLIESELTEQGLLFLMKYSRDRNADIRCRTAEALALSDSPEAEAILLRMLNDRDDMVRVNACDSLGTSGTQRAIETLKKHTMPHMPKLERGYAVISMADISVRFGSREETAAFLQASLETEMDIWVRNNYYRSLYLLGKKEYLPILLGSLEDENYQNRCETVNLLSDMADDSSREMIREAFIERLRKEAPDSIGVISTIEVALGMLGSAE